MERSKLGIRLLLGGREADQAADLVRAAWRSAGSIVGAAELLDVSPRTLTRWLDRFPVLAELDQLTRACGASDGRRGPRAA